MGEIANDLIEQGFDQLLYGDDVWEGFAEYPGRGVAFCRHCGGGPFRWARHLGGWRLLTISAELHDCLDHGKLLPSRGLWDDIVKNDPIIGGEDEPQTKS